MNRRFVPVAAFVLAAVLWSGAASAQSCTGRFVNPITDVCWECLFPISIGPISIGSVSGVLDTPNPPSPICFCGSPIPRIGLSLGVWEPARLVDVSRTPWCFPNLGGLTINPGLPAGRGRTGAAGGDGAKGSVWHAHYYMYPLLSWIGVLLDLGCLEGGGLDIAWASELDPAWLDDELTFLLNPEAALFANLPAQAACAADCAASSVGLPLDPLFWCAGCQGGMYPLTGNVAAHVGGVQASLLAAQRLLYRLHRAGLAWGTFGSGALCGRYPMPVMKKSQYRWQMTQPVPAVDPFTGCNPTGRSSVLWETLRELPVAGENFGFLLWKKTQLLSPLNRLIHNGYFPIPEWIAMRTIYAQAPTVPVSDRAAAGGVLVPATLRAEELRARAGCRRRPPGRGCPAQGGRQRRGDRSAPGPGRSSTARWNVPARPRGRRSPDRSPGQSGSVLRLRSRPNAMPGAFAGARSGGTAEILIFTSLSVPAASWRQWARNAARTGAPLVLRGVGEGGLPETAKAIGERLGGAEAGVAIDPRLFRLFGVTRVPAVVVVPGGVPACRSRGCADDPAPPHDRIDGNIGLIAALEAVADEGSLEGRLPAEASNA